MEGFKIIFDRRLLTLIILVLAIILIPLPQFVSLYLLIHIIDTILIILFAVSFNLVYGYMGELPLGHACFFGLGAYTMFLLVRYTEINFALVLLISLCVVAAYAAFVASLIVRLSGIYFALCSLAFGEFIAILFWSLREAGGDVGMHLSIITIHDMVIFYYITLAVVAVSLVIIYKIVNSPFGLTIQSIRDNEVRSRSVGVNVLRYKKINFIISALFTGVAGILYSILFSIVHPRFCSWAMLLNPLVGTLLGGAGSFIGPIIGTALYYQVYWIISENTIYWQYFTGGLIMVLVLFFPQGIMGYLERKLKR